MKLEVNSNEQFVVNGIVLADIPTSTVRQIHHYLFSHYLIARAQLDDIVRASDVVAEAEKILETETALDTLCDLETADWDLEDEDEL